MAESRLRCNGFQSVFMFEVVRTSMRSDLFSAMAMHVPPIGPTDILSYGDLYGQERIDRHPTVPHILLTVHGTVPTMWPSSARQA